MVLEIYKDSEQVAKLDKGNISIIHETKKTSLKFTYPVMKRRFLLTCIEKEIPFSVEDHAVIFQPENIKSFKASSIIFN